MGDSCLYIGSNVTLNNLIDILRENASKPGFKYFNVLADHLTHVASTPIRNVGCWAGNLRIKLDHPEFPSDVALILEACNAIIQTITADGAMENCSPDGLNALAWEQRIMSMLILRPFDAQVIENILNP